MLKEKNLSKQQIENVFEDLELTVSNNYPAFSPNFVFDFNSEKRIFTTILSSDSIPLKIGNVKDANMERPSK
jgi:hypothetical protein